MSTAADGAWFLTSELIDFLREPVSIKAGSCSHDHVPSVTHAYGCRVLPATAELCVFLSASHSAAVLRDLRAGGALSVVFSRPATHRTVQFKARAAHIEPLTEEDGLLFQRHGLRVASELVTLGYGPAFATALMAPEITDPVRVRFVPTAAFDQSPGAQAGRPLGAAP